MLAELRNKIRASHGNDKAQLKVVFTNKKRAIVEAPAGCGKTKTMISKVAYLLAAQKVPFPKKILALTFSVNAAYKIKKDVAEKLPELLSTSRISPAMLKNRVLATNYHGFCRRVLRLYGYLIDPNLKKIDTLKAVDDSSAENLTKLKIGISHDDAFLFSNYNKAVKERNEEFLMEHWDWYVEAVKKSFLAKNHITFNAILILVTELFNKHPSVLAFYKKIFTVIIVDEFQDTNMLSWGLIKRLLGDDTTIMFMGDPLQRIYGFIGALPGLMDHAHKDLEMEKYELVTNYRFKDNCHLLLIDKNIRENAKNPRGPDVDKVCLLKTLQGDNQPDEAQLVCRLIKSIIDKDKSRKLAILTKQRGPNIDTIMEAINKENLKFFYALFSDDDFDYIKFHQDAMSHFIKALNYRPGTFNKYTGKRFFNSMKRVYDSEDKEIFRSLLKLLEVFLETIFREYSFLDIDEKVDFIRDTIDSRSLKQYLEYVDSNIIVSTVHGAKGLEWDYVIISDMEQFLFPNWFGLCGECTFKNKKNCVLDWPRIPPKGIFENQFYDELSVFYVAATRAREDLYFSMSETRYKYDGTVMPSKPSCFMSLEGFSVV